MQIIVLVLLAAIAGAVVYWLLRRSAHQKRKNILLTCWQEELPNLTYQFRFVPPDTQERTDASQLSARDLPNIAIAQLSNEGVDPSKLTAGQRKEYFDGRLQYIKFGMMGGEQFMVGRQRYERLVRKALGILEDTENRYTHEQQVAAELLLMTPIVELTKVHEWDADSYLEKLCGRAAAASVSQAKAGSRTAAGAAPEAGDPLREVIAERVMAQASVAGSGVDPANAHREMPANRKGKVAEVIKQVDAVSEEEFYFERLKARDPEGLLALRRRLYPLAWAGIAKQDLSLAEALRVASVLGLQTSELGVEELEEKYRVARAAQDSGLPGVDAWADFAKAGELVASRFGALKPLWKMVGTQYEGYLGSHFRDLEMQSSPEGTMFFMSFLFLHDDWYKAEVRQMEPEAALVWDPGPARKSLPGAPAVLLLLAGNPNPVVYWPVSKHETMKLDSALAVTRLKGLERELHISLDGSRNPDGLPGGSRWAVVRRDRISGEVKGIEARGHSATAA